MELKPKTMDIIEEAKEQIAEQPLFQSTLMLVSQEEPAHLS
jgi:hypothetical protein